MSRWPRITLQLLAYATFLAVVWYFSVQPVYHPIGSEQAEVVVAFQHATQPLRECRRTTAEELAELPPNMRTLITCSRGRSPLKLEVRMDGKRLIDETIQPPGLYNDGSVNVYLATRVAAGKHLFELKLNDNARAPDQYIVHREERELQAARILVIRYSTEKGFVLE